MLKRFSNQQLEKLLLHTVGINSILTEVLLNPQAEKAEEAQAIGGEVNIDVLVINPENLRGTRKQQDVQTIEADALCGDWKGGRKKPDLLIFKAAPGYMIALGKKPKNDEVGDCWLIHEFKGNLSFNAGDGIVILSYDKETDKLTLYPGGEYCRAEEADK